MAKSKYESHVKPYFSKIRRWRRVHGLTEKEIAKRLGISVTTMEVYKTKYPAFLKLIKETREVLLDQLEESLFRKAFGDEYEEVTSELVDGKMIETKRVKKKIVASDTALIFALKNIAKDWRTDENMIEKKHKEQEAKSSGETVKNDSLTPLDELEEMFNEEEE